MRSSKWKAAAVVVALAVIVSSCDPATGGTIEPSGDSAYMGIVFTGGGGLSTGASQSVSPRALADGVEELNIGSADIFSFSYDEANGRWDSPAGISGSGNTYENDPEAILITDSLSFTADGNDLTDSLEMANMPARVDVIFFDNRWHNVTVESTQYGDHNRNGAYLSRTNRLPTGEAFSSFDIVFISDEFISQKCLVRQNGSIEILSSGIEDEAEVLAAVEEVHRDVMNIEEYALFIPMTAFDFDPARVSVEISVDLSNLVDEVAASDVIYSLDEEGSPITCSISVVDAIDLVDFNDDGDDDLDDESDSDGGVSEFNIGSADIFSFSYDFGSDRWNSPAAISGSGNTYENDDQAVLIADALGFTSDLESVASEVNTDKFPSTIDILYFDTRWHNLTVDGIQYGDHGRNGDYEQRSNHLPDGTAFEAFDIVYVNRAIVPTGCLVRSVGGSLIMETAGVANESVILEAVGKISAEVRGIEEYALFIPIDPIPYDRSTTDIIIGIRTENLFLEINGSAIIYSLDEKSSPLTYAISVDNN